MLSRYTNQTGTIYAHITNKQRFSFPFWIPLEPGSLPPINSPPSNTVSNFSKRVQAEGAQGQWRYKLLHPMLRAEKKQRQAREKQRLIVTSLLVDIVNI
jgi:hypothetical protein